MLWEGNMEQDLNMARLHLCCVRIKQWSFILNINFILSTKITTWNYVEFVFKKNRRKIARTRSKRLQLQSIMDSNKHFRTVLSNFQHFRPVLWAHFYLTLIFRSCVWWLGGLDLRKAWRDLLIFRGVAWHRSSRFLTASLSNHPNRRGDIRRVKSFGQRNESVIIQGG